MMDQIHVCQDGEHLAVYACQWLQSQILRHAQDEERNQHPFVLALSGGSTPKRLLQLLADLPAGRIDWSKIILIWGDERNVAPDHDDSNFRMVQDALLSKIAIPAENVLAVPNPGGSAKDAAKQYNTLLATLPTAGESTFPIIDCVLLGMGDDVHTASLFPGTKALGEQKRIVVENFVEKLDTTRITLTAPAINAARNVAFLICGEAKQTALSLLWHAPHNAQKYPSQLIRPANGQLWMLLDKAALGDTPLPQNVMVQML